MRIGDDAGRNGLSYTVTTMKSEAWGNRWKELFDLAHIGVLTRPGSGGALPTELRTKIASRRCSEPRFVREAPAGRVLTIPVTPLDISASQIRELLAEGREPRWLVSDALFADPQLLEPYRG